jgi:hypothetical protein
MKNKPLYIVSSYGDFLFSLFFRICMILAIVYICFHYVENPDLLGTLAVIAFIFFMMLGSSQFWIYNNKIVERSDSIISFVFRWRHKTVYISDISRAILVPIPEDSPQEKSNQALLSILFGARFQKNTSPPVLLYMKDGEELYLPVTAGIRQKTKMVETINSLVKQPR